MLCDCRRSFNARNGMLSLSIEAVYLYFDDSFLIIFCNPSPFRSNVSCSQVATRYKQMINAAITILSFICFYFQEISTIVAITQTQYCNNEHIGCFNLDGKETCLSSHMVARLKVCSSSHIAYLLPSVLINIRGAPHMSRPYTTRRCVRYTPDPEEAKEAPSCLWLHF